MTVTMNYLAFTLNTTKCRTNGCNNNGISNGLYYTCYIGPLRCSYEDCDKTTYGGHTLCRKHWRERGCELCGRSMYLSLWKYKRSTMYPRCGHCCIKCTRVIEHPNKFYPTYCSNECSGVCQACGAKKILHEGFVYDPEYGYDHSKDPRKNKCNYCVCSCCGQWRFARFGTGDHCVNCRNVDMLEKHIERLPEMAFGKIREYV